MKNTPEIFFPNLDIKIQHLDRVAINLFGLNIYWYGVFINIAMLLGIFLILKQIKQKKEEQNLYLDFIILAIISAVIGARIYYVAFSFDNYKQNLWEVFNIRQGGLAIYGAVIASVMTAIIYCKKKGIKFFSFIDVFIPSLVLGQAIGRWGNFVNKEAFGDYTNSLFAMALRIDTVSSIREDLLMHIISYQGARYIQVHPTFLYESFSCLVIFIFLFWYRKYKNFDGEIFLLYLIGYSIVRFFIEGLRTDQLLILNKIPVSQLLSIIILIIAGTLEIVIRKKYRILKN